MQRLRRIYLLLLSGFLLTLVASCKKDQATIQTLPFPQPVGTGVTVTLHPESAGSKIPESFLGFSYEISALTDSSFLSVNDAVLLQLYKNLGNGYIRVGGNSSDELVWTGGPRTSGTGKDSLTTTDIDGFSAFARATGWPVLFGLNLGEYNVSKAVNEAGYVAGSLQGSLSAFQIGNEADLFHDNGLRASSYNYAEFRQEWENYFNAVRAVQPSAPFAGPDVADNQAWIDSFSMEEHTKVGLIDGHFYRAGPASSPSIVYQTILAPDAGLTTYLTTFLNESESYSLGFRISECNSVYDGGKTGVSNVFASALWALDYMWTVASARGQGINFHGGTGGAYSPVVRSSGVWSARPEYYAMLAFKEGAQGSLVPADAGFGSLNASAYASINNGIEFLTLINKDVQPIAFTVLPGINASQVQVMRLTAPSYTDQDSVSFSNAQVDAGGNFTPGTPENYGGGSSFIVNVPAGNAAVVIIR